jgi:hypothetical protein
MPLDHAIVCSGCGDTEEVARLERCPICSKYICGDCGMRGGLGRRFCSLECSRAYFFSGDSDDDEDNDIDE